MNELSNEQIKENADKNENRPFRKSYGHVWGGLFVLAIGAALLLRQTGAVAFPQWFFTWPVLLIGIGLLSGIRHGFRRGPWLILTAVGALFLIDEIQPNTSFRNYIWPIVLMVIGLGLIIRPRRARNCRNWQRFQQQRAQQWQNRFSEVPATSDPNDFIDITSVFSGVKKIVLSKHFRGGDITTFMGGSEVNLTQADIQGRITIDATNIFGGTKLIIPPTWDVQSEVVAIFGGVDDKRQITGEAPNPDKVIRLEGTCLFGGIEIKSF